MKMMMIFQMMICQINYQTMMIMIRKIINKNKILIKELMKKLLNKIKIIKLKRKIKKIRRKIEVVKNLKN